MSYVYLRDLSPNITGKSDRGRQVKGFPCTSVQYDINDINIYIYI